MKIYRNIDIPKLSMSDEDMLSLIKSVGVVSDCCEIYAEFIARDFDVRLIRDSRIMQYGFRTVFRIPFKKEIYAQYDNLCDSYVFLEKIINSDVYIIYGVVFQDICHCDDEVRLMAEI